MSRPIAKRFIVDNQESGRNAWKAGYDDVTAAEKAARYHTATYDRDCLIYDSRVPFRLPGTARFSYLTSVIALTLKDPLGRVWTQVEAGPSETTLL